MKKFWLCLLVLASIPVTAADYSKDTVVAERGGAKVTFADVDALVSRMRPSERAKSMDNPTRIENTLTQMLLVTQMANQAREMGLDKDPEVQADIAWAIAEKLATARSERFLKDVKIPDLEPLAKEKYAANKHAFDLPEQRSARHLLIAEKPGLDSAQAKALAEKLRAEAAANPDRFEELVMEHSDDDSKTQNRGMIEDALSDRLDAAFVEGARALAKVGDISQPVHSQFGWHLIKLEKLRPAKARSYAEIHDELLASLQKAFVDQKKKDFIDELRNMKLEAQPDVVASIRTRYADGTIPTSDKPAQPAQDTKGGR